jgi:hypothetical protein
LGKQLDPTGFGNQAVELPVQMNQSVEIILFNAFVSALLDVA